MRPNSGKISPKSAVEVQVLLQAMKEDPPPDARCRDKFLVQSVAVDANTDAANIASVWNNIETAAKSSVQEKKIRVNFLPADATTNGVSHDEEQPPAYSSPSPSAAAVTPQRSTGAAAASANSAMDKSPSPDTTAASGIGAGAVASSIPTNQEDLRAKLDDANATIARLRSEAAEGLRQRKPQESAEKAVDQVKQSMQNAPAPGGVPLPVVAGLCLLCFIIAWMFF